MRVLVSNDDGIFALGIRTLANTLATAGHEVTVVCPDRERSATGHGLTLHQPIRAEQIVGIFDPAVAAWSCSGTPSDCVKLALHALLDPRPDVVLSGINHGPNLGTDVLYSGTVSAAMEGAIEGIPSMAMSLVGFTEQNFQVAADFARSLLAQKTAIATALLAEPILLNVNVPNVADASEITGAIVTRQGLRRYIEQFEKRQDPRGKSYYWLAGEAIEDIEQPHHQHLPADIRTDVQAIKDRYITIAPLQFDLTDSWNCQRLQAAIGDGALSLQLE
ncbi:MAG: 5'/3'-nucleotidase SurE [Cyanobacteria bacterium J06641_5]